MVFFHSFVYTLRRLTSSGFGYVRSHVPTDREIYTGAGNATTRRAGRANSNPIATTNTRIASTSSCLHATITFTTPGLHATTISGYHRAKIGTPNQLQNTLRNVGKGNKVHPIIISLRVHRLLHPSGYVPRPYHSRNSGSERICSGFVILHSPRPFDESRFHVSILV